ncbi:acetyl-CoA carboxylase biotin carboxyl carrier protein subunit [Alteribacillus bidgolensis]|uniref:Acetyl-CoA carboxylase biotin carboxyl carrier protein n=1 Tax=Alteribacillus bidgolensis TaxID=930129 RepID=A0A1G8N1L4_9BACI|nr:acetyl-CoA carboxylase biotin carboxyl carrier protein subunit [Alteribacillus bidgolensis]SDI74151.1 acetyl-CoA carboxylase biotin carboxyl carrier protein [Alteribacillus bidgolensis]
MNVITASMAGNLWKLLVSSGEEVKEGQEVAILESMKMEIPITAKANGKIKTVLKEEGEFVNEGDELFELE